MSRPGVPRRWGLIAAFVSIIGIGATAWLAGTRVQSPARAAARAAPPAPSLVTAPVEHRVLASTVIARGEVKPIATFSINGPTLATGSDAAAGVVTGLWVSAGDEVSAGQRVVEVSGRPVFVFAGATPAYRAMRPGMSGPDIVQLRAGLVARGCAAGDVGDGGVYDDAVKECVEQLYADAGYDALRGSPTELADLAAAETAAADAADSLAAAEAALTAAQQPAARTDVAAIERRIERAERSYATAVIEGHDAVAAAWTTFDAQLAALNGLLAGAGSAGGAGSDADGAQAGVGGGAADGAGGGAAGGGGVAQRQAAWAAVLVARTGVRTAARQATATTSDARAEVEGTTDELTVLTASPDVAAEQLVVAQRRAAVARADRHLAELTAASGAIVPYGEIVFVAELPVRVASVSAGVGGAGANGGGASGGPSGDGGALVTLASPTLLATVSLPASARSLVHEGMEVVLLDEASGETVVGTIAAITDRPQSQGAGTPAHLATVDALLPDTWAGRNVRATLTAAATDGEVLVVPSASISSSAGGETRVRVERAGGTVETVPVHVGLSADGFVEVTPQPASALRPGDRVVIGQQRTAADGGGE